jgi:hypothetical protein
MNKGEIMPGGIRALLVGLFVYLVAFSVRAQGLEQGEPECKRSQSPLMGFSPVDAVIEQRDDLANDWCKVVRNSEKVHNTQAFLVDLASGGGIHLTEGNVAPGSSFALGAALNFAINKEATEPDQLQLRSRNSIEFRHSLVNGFWGIGVTSNILIPKYTNPLESPNPVDLRDPQVSVVAQYLDLPTLPYYGFGNSTQLLPQALYSLHRTTMTLSYFEPLPLNFAVTPSLAWVVDRATNPPGSNLTNIASVFPGDGGRALNETVQHIAAGVALDWRGNLNNRLHGFSPNLVLAFQSFSPISGSSKWFGSVEGIARADYSPGLSGDFGTLSGAVRVHGITTHPGDVAFYMLPTIGGGELGSGATWLRAYTDYRFRGQATAAANLRYERRIVDPVGVVLFADAGKALASWSDSFVTGLHGSAGGGLSLRLGGGPVFEVLLGRSEEGTTLVTFGNSNGAGMSPANETSRLTGAFY